MQRKLRKLERGAVALEYILIAALLALALVGSFIYLRQKMTSALTQEGDALESTVADQIKEGAKVPESGGGGSSSESGT